MTMQTGAAPDAASSARSSDGALVVRTIAGEADAYADLVRRHQQILHRYLRGMGVDYDTALDLVQDAFVKAYVRLGECREPDHFRAWLFSIGRHLCLDYLKNVRRQSVPLSEVPDVERAAAWHAGPGEAAGAVREALDLLTPLLREAFLLKHDAGYTYDEIAAIAGVSPSAIKMRVHRARDLLCAALHGPAAADVTIRRPPLVLHQEHDERQTETAARRGAGPGPRNGGTTVPEPRSDP